MVIQEKSNFSACRSQTYHSIWLSAMLERFMNLSRLFRKDVGLYIVSSFHLSPFGIQVTFADRKWYELSDSQKTVSRVFIEMIFM